MAFPHPHSPPALRCGAPKLHSADCRYSVFWRYIILGCAEFFFRKLVFMKLVLSVGEAWYRELIERRIR